MTSASAEPAHTTFLLRPLTVALFIALLAGQFSFDRLGIANPLFVPERLLGFGLLTFVVGVVGFANIRSVPSRPPTGIIVAAPIAYALVTSLWGADTPNFWISVSDISCMLLSCVIMTILLNWDSTLVAETFLWCMVIAGTIYAAAGLLAPRLRLVVIRQCSGAGQMSTVESRCSGSLLWSAW